MKSFKKVFSGVLAAAMAVTCFAGCTSNSDKEDNSGSKADSANTSGSIVIGCTGPLTGDASQYGISVQRGAQLAVDEINGAGGINGINYSFIMKDDKANATETNTAYDQLMDEGMQISLGSVTSASCEAFAAKSVDDNLFFITPSASNADIIDGRDNGFRVCFGDPDQGILAADKLVNEYKKTKIGCIYDTSDTYSSGIYEAFKGEMDKLGVSFTTMTFDKENNKDFSTQVEALKDCDAIFTPFYYTEAGLVARACAAKGVNALIFGCDGLDGVADQIDSSVTNEIQYITPFDKNSTDEKVASFVNKYAEKYGSAPDQFAADAYDAIYVIFNAMKAADIKDANISVSDLCNKVRAAILDSSFKFSGVTGNMTWNENGAPNKEPIVVTVKK